MTYDPKNVEVSEVEAGSAKTMASIIYPKEPRHRLEIWWSNVDKRKDTYLIAINGASTWMGPHGLRLGLSLADLEKLNRKPFKLKGFDKGKVAAVTDWDGGTLAALPGGCKAGVFLRAEAKAAIEVIAALPGDHEFSPTPRCVLPDRRSRKYSSDTSRQRRKPLAPTIIRTAIMAQFLCVAVAQHLRAGTYGLEVNSR